MTHPFWDKMYDGQDYRYGTAPNAFLAEQAARLAPDARVLSVGDGEGRNGVWLAGRGFEVTTVEPSEVGVAKARALAARQGVTLRQLQGFFPHPEVAAGRFDAVALIYIHQPPDKRPGLHRAAVEALAPGGLVILEGFTPQQLGRDSGGPQDLAMLFTPEALREDFDGLELLHLEALEVDLDEGPGHRGRAAVVRLLARKP